MYITFRQTKDELIARREFTGILQNADESLNSKEEGEHNNG